MSGFASMRLSFFLAVISLLFVPDVFTRLENLEQNSKTYSHIHAKNNVCTIDFFAVDLKYNHGALKVLEFQDGPQAGLRAHDEIFGKGLVWRMFWDWLAQFNVPIWYVGILPRSIPDGNFSHYDKERIVFDYFLKNIKGRYVKDLKSLERDLEFKRVSHKEAPQDSILTGCKGIVLIKDYPLRSIVNQLKKKYPNFVFINQHSRRSSDNKFLTDQLFQDNELKQFRPYARRFHKQYYSKLAHDIINEFGSDYYVIKPVNSSRSNGVIMATKEELDIVLKKILVNKKPHGNFGGSYRPDKPLTYDYWLGDNNHTFIVEKYEPSQHIEVNGKLYDPTIRAICVMYNNNGNIVAEVLEAFWKIPPQPLSKYGDLTEMHVSKYRSDFSKLSKDDLTVKSIDMLNLKNILSSVISKVYVKMLDAGA